MRTTLLHGGWQWPGELTGQSVNIAVVHGRSAGQPIVPGRCRSWLPGVLPSPEDEHTPLDLLLAKYSLTSCWGQVSQDPYAECNNQVRNNRHEIRNQRQANEGQKPEYTGANKTKHKPENGKSQKTRVIYYMHTKLSLVISKLSADNKWLCEVSVNNTSHLKVV